MRTAKSRSESAALEMPLAERLQQALAREANAVAAVGEAAADAVTARLGAAALVAEAAETLSKRDFRALCSKAGVAKPEDYLKANARRDEILDRLNGQCFLPFTQALLEPPKEHAVHENPAEHRAEVIAKAAEAGEVAGFDFGRLPAISSHLEARLKNVTADLRGALQTLQVTAERMARGMSPDEGDIARLRQIAAKAEGGSL